MDCRVNILWLAYTIFIWDIHRKFYYVMDANTCNPVENVSRRNPTLWTLIVNLLVHIRQKKKIIPEIAAKHDKTCDVLVE